MNRTFPGVRSGERRVAAWVRNAGLGDTKNKTTFAVNPCGARAEGEGFEPSVAYATPVFKTGAIGHSATPPILIFDNELRA